jgi:hypothetical protein
MNQSPKEIVQAALRFQNPARLPVKMGCFGCDDTIGIPVETRREKKNGIEVDEWGCAWEKTDVKNMGQVKGHPLASLSEYEKVTVPDYSLDWRFEDSEKALRLAEKEEKYAMAGIFMILFERMHSLAGFENVLVGLYDDRANAEALADKIVDAHLVFVRSCQERFGKRLHAFGMTEDWGTQNAAFISMDLWYDFFFPRYKRLFDAMHEGGQDVWVHSCGKVNEVIGGFIAAGADSVNLQQPRALGIEEIGSRYRGRITFESLSDIQASLPTGDMSKIVADSRQLEQHWMKREGGFVFSDYGDGQAIGAPIEAKRAMYRAFSAVSQDLYGKPLPALA